MTNYNNGDWHGWNGGECPVHPKTIIQHISVYGGKVTDSSIRDEIRAELVSWVRLDESGIVAFRVVKEYREPREWWALWSPSGTLIGNFTECSAHEKNDDYYGGRGEIIHVREVLE